MASFYNLISIHAPPRGATAKRAGAFIHAGRDFNSRPSARGDQVYGYNDLQNPSISIHAPPRGATQRICRRTRCCSYFNSRPSARGDKPAESKYNTLWISIHAPPRGATPKEGKEMSGFVISIHAPPRGATETADNNAEIAKFQFTPLREGRRRSHPLPRENRTIFQFTPLREGRLIQYKIVFAKCRFQFTPLREGRLFCGFKRPQRCSFQFTPLREGRLIVTGKWFNAFIFQFTPLREGRPYRSIL